MGGIRTYSLVPSGFSLGSDFPRPSLTFAVPHSRVFVFFFSFFFARSRCLNENFSNYRSINFLLLHLSSFFFFFLPLMGGMKAKAGNGKESERLEHWRPELRQIN